MKTYRQLMEDVADVTKSSYRGGGRGTFGMPSRTTLYPTTSSTQSLSAGADSYDSKTTTGMDFRGLVDKGMDFARDNKGALLTVGAGLAGAALFRPALNALGGLFGKKDGEARDIADRERYDDNRQITKDNVSNSMQAAKSITSQKPKKIGAAQRTDNKPGAGISAPKTKLG